MLRSPLRRVVSFKGGSSHDGLLVLAGRVQALWDQTTVLITSEFGRTLVPNSSEGTDHSWAGHALILGGAVKGGQIHGQYPRDLTEMGHLNIGRGRLIPDMSWESVFMGPLEWMGVDDEHDLDYCMPNRHGSGSDLPALDQIFHSTGRRNLRGS